MNSFSFRIEGSLLELDSCREEDNNFGRFISFSLDALFLVSLIQITDFYSIMDCECGIIPMRC